MYSGWFILHLAGFLYMSNVCTGIIQHGFMTNYFFSHRPVEVNDSMILELTSRRLEDRPGKDHLACDVNIVTLPSRRILIHFLSLEISSDEKEVDRLHVYDYKLSGEDVRLTPTQGLYGLYDAYYRGTNRRLDDYQSTDNRLKLDYQGKPTLAYDGFKILITSFRDARGDCGRGYLRCARKSICIPASLWCDGYNNCGRDDNSDEANCFEKLEDEWKPIDGTVTAVLAAALSTTAFVISLAILAFVVLRISKRQVLTTNIIVEYKRRKSPKRQVSNGEMLTRLYAPPSYEVVVGMNEEPPPYHWVTGETETDSDEDDGILREQPSGATGNCLPSTSGVDNRKYIRNSWSDSNNTARGTTSTVVSCDVHGNDVSESKIDVDVDVLDHSDCLAQTNYRLCSSAQSIGSSTKMASSRGDDYDDVPEIDIIPSDDSDSSKDSNRNSRRKYNGNLVVSDHNGDVNKRKLNGQTIVTYQHTPSQREIDAVEFMDSE